MTTTQLRQAPRGLAVGAVAGMLPAAAAALSLSSAIAHFGVVSSHWQEWWAHGAFFLVCGALQAIIAALLMWRPRAWNALAGIAGNLAVVSMYVYSRTNGSPIGPHEGVPEEPGYYDLITTAGELALIVVLILMLGERQRRWGMNLALLTAVGLWAGKATGFLV
jgi:hypothetical protein